MKEITIGWVSAGITSAVACKMAFELYPNVVLYYIETGSAHPDNKRFLSDLQKWYGQEINIIKNNYYHDVLDVIYKTRYINGSDGARCTKELKKEVRFLLERKYTKDLFNSIEYTGQVFGFEYDKKQVNRAIRFKQQYSNSKPLFPLITKGLNKDNGAGILINAGIELPVMYKMGYSNNNCVGCVKGGKGYWNKIRIDFPNVFKSMSIAERHIGHSCIKDCFLDELNPNTGNMLDEVMPNCGIFCDVEFSELEDKNLDKIMNTKII